MSVKALIDTYYLKGLSDLSHQQEQYNFDQNDSYDMNMNDC